MSSGPSPHLTWAELACKDGTPYPEALRATRAVDLADLFERIREACGNVPITILSAYRSPAHNKAIGGAKNSQHLQGRALDLRPPAGMSLSLFYAICRGQLPGGIGRYQTFVHVDTRPGLKVVAWDGGSQRKDDRE